MTPERWQQVKAVFQAALERSASDRESFLNAACAGDEALRAEVASLLAEQEKLSGFIATPVMEKIEVEAAPSNRRIGPYRIERELGHGGMGVVYLALRDDDQYQKQVAIKLIRRGFDADHVVNRFRHERQILATLDHPNIARLLDGGTTEDGLPYFVMEYVEGLPIDDYCDEHRLKIEARLELFRKVCAAVQYAHQNLIVHRDLKPGNILITREGEPKLLDFGIAKLLNPEAFPGAVPATATWERPMTLAYASPEQTRGLPVTTASDIYSLGVVLYELLTGRRPYRVEEGGLPHELARVICEQEPERPSTAISRVEAITQPAGEETVRITPDAISRTRGAPQARLRRQLKGDLDNIVLVALRKEAQRRYASVEQFSDDIGRYLEGRPVIARPATVAYRAAKFIQRHKAGVVAAALIVVSLLGGIIVSTRQARIAERRFNDVRQLANSYLFEFHDAIEDLPGSTPARQLVVKRALEYLDRLAQESGGDAALDEELAAAYLKVGDVQGRPGFANLGDRAGAIESYRKSLAIREALLVDEPNNATTRRDQATTHDRIGDTLRVNGDTAAALEHYGQALKLREALAVGAGDQQTQVDLAISYERIGDQLALLGKRAEALEHQRRALPIIEQAAAADPGNAQFQRRLFISFIKLGDRLGATGDRSGALDRYQQALPIAQKLAAADASNARARRELAVAYDKVGNGLAATGEANAAMGNYRRALEIREQLSAADPKNSEARRDLATSFDKVGETLTRLNQPAAAIQYFRRALTIDEALSSAEPNNAQPQLDRAHDHEQISEALAKSGDLVAAIAERRRAAELQQAVSMADPANEEVKRDLAASQAQLGEWAMALAEKPNRRQIELWQEARSWFERSADYWNGLRAQRTLESSEAETAEKIAAAITKCDQALAKSQGRPPR